MDSASPNTVDNVRCLHFSASLARAASAWCTRFSASTPRINRLEGRSEGDPRKIADVIVQLANRDEVPLRLILGVDAEKRAHGAEAARANEAEKWRHLTVSTVFEDAESIPELRNH